MTYLTHPLPRAQLLDLLTATQERAPLPADDWSKVVAWAETAESCLVGTFGLPGSPDSCPITQTFGDNIGSLGIWADDGTATRGMFGLTFDKTYRESDDAVRLYGVVKLLVIQ